MSADNDLGAKDVRGDPSEPALWELALRLIPPQHGPHGPSPEEPRIWPGQLPDLPFELPVADRARVVGSYGRGQHLTVLIDTAATPKECVAFYDERMLASGWNTPSPQLGPGGFLPPHLAQQAQALFCRGAEGSALTVLAQLGADGITHGTLTINVDPESNPCRSSIDHQQPGTPMGPHLPPLEAPAGCHLVGHVISGGPNITTALATLTTDLDATAVAEHYGRQLEEAGWHRDEAGESGPVTWRLWTFLGRGESPAHGILTVIREAGAARRYALSLYARHSEPNLPSSGA